MPVFVGLILLFGFLLFPAKKGDNRVNYLPWYDVVLLIAGPGAYFFYAVNADEVIRMSARVMQNDLYMIVGLIGVLALIELCRRCVGLPILCVPGVLLVYTFFNLMGGAPLGIEQIRLAFYQVIRTMFYTFNGIFGGPINVCAKFIVVFIIFGAFFGAHRYCTVLHQPGQRAGRRPPAAPLRWRSSPPPCVEWCPAPLWATRSLPALSLSP